ncbi:MAG: chlorophyll A-B binding protein [Leptolyngbya sp. SIO4C5]|uniref:chlorophyll a/b-binding protein n=1 Tax=Sphaerothrix gracilis TaxID=3151835 RepID=UPI0013C28B88|nr:chlorophyll A-B binding protein [Leptolyngbya sp. SIO4C5]
MTQPNKPTNLIGFTPAAERLNGRLAMLGFVTAVVIELVSGQGVLQFLGIL